MKVQPILCGLALLVLAGCQHSLVRESMPTVTRTGEVKDIIIREHLTPVTVSAKPGDEIRWINKRQGDVRVIFLSPVMEMFSCQRNFGSGFFGPNRNEYAADLGPNETASVCFKNAGEIKYVVRAKSDVPSGEQNLAGALSIGTGDRAAAGEPERSDRRAAQARDNEEQPSAR